MSCAHAPVSVALRLAAIPVAGLALATNSVGAAPAEVRPDSVVNVIDEIVVTARRREERLQDVPVSSSVLPDTLIRELAIRDLADIQYQAPNLNIAPFPAVSADASISMRGQSQFEPVITLDPAVAIYVDGVYLGRSTGALLNLVDLERVEVLLGPQGTLYGRNTTGGVIHLISKKNTEGYMGGSVNVTAGNFGRNDYSAALDFPLIADKLTARASFRSTNRDGFGENSLLSEDLENERARSWRVNVNWSPTQDLGVLISADRTKQRERTSLFRINTLDSRVRDPDCLEQTNVSFGCLVNFAVTSGDWAETLAGDPRTIRSDVSSRHDLDVFGASATITADFNRFSIKSITAYRELERRNANDIDGTEWAILHPDASADQQQFSQELQLSLEPANSRVKWLAGVFYFDESGNDNTTVVSVPALNPVSPSTILPHGENLSYAAFGHMTYALGEHTNLVAGVRHTRERRLLNEEQRNAAECTLEFTNRPSCRTEVSRRFSGWSYVVGIDHHWNSNVMTYATTSRGFKSGGFNARAVTEFEFRPFDPEIVESYELGLKATGLEGRARLDIAYFYSDLSDIQRAGLVALSPTEIASTVKNAASAYVSGGELRATVLPASDWLWDIAVGSTIAHYRVFDDVDALGNRIDKSHLKFPKTPKWNLSTRLQYKRPFSSGNELSLQAAYTWQSMTHPDVENAPGIAQGAIGLLDLRASAWFDRNSIEIAVNAKNLTDETYVTDGLDFSDQFGYTGVFFGAPRTFSVELNWLFGEG